MGRGFSGKNFAFVLLFLLFIIILTAVMVMNGKQDDDANAIKNHEMGSSATIQSILSVQSIEQPEQTSGEITEETITTAGIMETDAPKTTGPPVKINPRVYQDKFDRIRAIYNNNEDIIGILKIPGTVIYYPVAYYAYDLNDFYLNHNLYKQRSAAGSIFMDFENSVERYDPNTILYGHRMATNSMFHALGFYENEDFFNSHRYIIFNTVYEDNVWEAFAFFKTHISFNYIKVFFRSEKSFLDLAAEMTERSMHQTGIEIKEGDRILTLSTCTNQDRDTRYVLCARMIKNKDDIPEEIAAQMANAADDFK
jgi:SrtB family sortase